MGTEPQNSLSKMVHQFYLYEEKFVSETFLIKNEEDTENKMVIVDKKCDTCGKMFLETQQKQAYKEDMSFICAECDMTFSSSSNMTKLQQSHTGEKNYKLTKSLQTELRQVKNEEYACSSFEQPFSHKKILWHHQYKSGNLKSRFENLKSRFENRLLEKKEFACYKCKKSFSYKKGLQRHQNKTGHKRTQTDYRTLEKKEFPCFKCDKSFSHIKGLHRHQKENKNKDIILDKLVEKSKHTKVIETEETAANEAEFVFSPV